MPAIDFPSGATSGTLHTDAGKTWVFNGSGWILVTIPTALFDTGSVAGSALQTNSVPLSKLMNSDPARVIVYNSSNTAAAQDITGDINISPSGVTSIASAVIVNGDISGAANIDATKIAGTALTLSSSGIITTDMIADSTIVDGDISLTASINRNKLAEPLTNAQAATYTLVLADRNKIVEMGVATANTLTVAPDSSVSFPVGTHITVLQTGAGQCTITEGAGVTINATPGKKMRAQWSGATLIKRAANSWVLIGDLSA